METKTITTLEGDQVVQVITLTKEQLEETYYLVSNSLDLKIVEQKNLLLKVAKVNEEVEELTTKKAEALKNLEVVLPQIDRKIPERFNFNPTFSEPEIKVEMQAPDFTNL